MINAKYYGNTMQAYYDAQTIHSGNLFQIFTYVKNKQQEDPKADVSGLLLYARTEEEIQPDDYYNMSGNKIGVKTLDLNKSFSTISESLNTIVMNL